MRVTKEKAADNREKILQAASRLIRERGISGAGVDALTDAAGMTHGSLYSQFGSKEHLVEEAVTYALAAKRQQVAEAGDDVDVDPLFHDIILKNPYVKILYDFVDELATARYASKAIALRVSTSMGVSCRSTRGEPSR